MTDLTSTERRALFDIIRKVHAYKLMQAEGYQRLAKKAQDERTKRLLAEISRNEVQDCEYWAEKARQLSGQELTRSSLLDWRVRLRMSILGTKGFSEWAIIAEDESVEDLAVLAENLTDSDSAQAWTRIAADERLHIERIKVEILGMEGWVMGGGGGVRDVIFGANDGLVSILALMAGVYGAATESRGILIAGIAGAVASASLASGRASLPRVRRCGDGTATVSICYCAVCRYSIPAAM